MRQTLLLLCALVAAVCVAPPRPALAASSAGPGPTLQEVGPLARTVAPEDAEAERATLTAKLAKLTADRGAILAEHSATLSHLNASYAQADRLVKRSVLACMKRDSYNEKRRSCAAHTRARARVATVEASCAKAGRPARCLDRNLARPQAVADATRWDCEAVDRFVAAGIDDVVEDCGLRTARRRDRFALRTFRNPHVEHVLTLRRRLGWVSREIGRVEQALADLPLEPTEAPEPSPAM